MENKGKKEDPKDPIISPLGDLGPYQLQLCLLVFISKFPSGWVQLSVVYLNEKCSPKCVEPTTIQDPCDSDCEKVEYNRTVFTETIVSEWDLICEYSHLASMSQAIIMAGIMIGNIVFGILSDRYGRRPTFVWSCILNLVAGCLVSIAPWFALFCFLRFVLAFATGGMMVTSFVIIMEIIGKSKREIMSIFYQIPFNLGHASLPLFAYLFRDWRWYHFSFSIFSVLYLIYLVVIPESPRWLFTTGRLEEAEKILEKAAKRNNMPTEQIHADLEEAYKIKAASAPLKKGTIIDLFRTPYLCIKTISMAFNWLVICLTYYCVSQHVTNIGGDIFLNVFLSAIIGLPGIFVCVLMTKYLGRKLSLIISNLISGVSLLVCACMPDISDMLELILTSISLFGASITFPNVYLYGGEIFPTVVRNSGVGLCSFVGRVGSIVAPYIADLGHDNSWIPPFIVGLFCIAAVLATFLLPETRGYLLPETLEDGENFGRKNRDPPST